MDDLGIASMEIASRSYCDFQEGAGGYLPHASLPIVRNEKRVLQSERNALEALKREFEILTGVESVTILENASGFNKDDAVCCRHVILVKLRSTPLREKVNDMNASFHYKLKRLGLGGVELRIEWEKFIFDPPL
jgi:hypothetical protein